MHGRFMFSGVNPEDLRTIAREATSDHIQHGTPLTDAVVKAASMFGHPLTSEHVRRVCEMSYHDTFERRFRELGGGADRYVSFDPPDAVEAAGRLRAEKVASTRTTKETPRMAVPAALEKAASAPRGKFQPVNAFDELVKTAEVEDPSKVVWYNPLSELTHVRSDLKEAVQELQVKQASLKGAEDMALSELVSHAEQMVKEGCSVAGVLHACLDSVKRADYGAGVLETVMDDLTIHLGTIGCPLESDKIASYGDVNSKHPLPRQFAKTAGFRNERIHVEYALEELRRDWDRVNDEIRTLAG